jgi:phage terminase large subunit GpA-like protein
LESCEPLKDYLTGNIDDIRRSEFTFTSCNLKVIGGGSAAKLSSNNICYLFLDEIDKFEDFTKEASVIELAIDRTITYQETGDAKIFMGSTPTLAGASEIQKHYEEGSQCKYHVPCPHCNHHQELVFAQIKWPDCKSGETYDLNKVEKTAFYECVNCKRPIHEDQKASMINKGGWVSMNLNAPSDIRSYHISTLYSLSVSWGYVARHFLTSKNDRGRLQNFYNSILGIPWTPQLSTITETNLTKLVAESPEYLKGFLPSKPKALVMGCDTQQDSNYFVVLAVLENDRVALIDWGQTISWEDLATISKIQYRIKDESSPEFYGLYGAFIDAGGNRTTQVYDFCKNTGNRFVPVFGRTESHRLFQPVRRTTINYKGEPLTIINVHDRLFSENILLNHLKSGAVDSIYLPKDADDGVLFKQFTNVSIIEKKDSKGFVQQEISSKGNEHYFDCLKYALALRYLITPILNTLDDDVEEESETEEEEPVSQSYSNW